MKLILTTCKLYLNLSIHFTCLLLFIIYNCKYMPMRLHCIIICIRCIILSDICNRDVHNRERLGIDPSHTHTLCVLLALIWNKADAQTRKDRILAEFTASEMRFAHTWCRGARGRMCRLFIHAFARCANKCERDGARVPSWTWEMFR